MEKKKPVLVVMAAGMGSRYGGMKQIDRSMSTVILLSIFRSMTRCVPDSRKWFLL